MLLIAVVIVVLWFRLLFSLFFKYLFDFRVGVVLRFVVCVLLLVFVFCCLFKLPLMSLIVVVVVLWFGCCFLSFYCFF